MEYQDYPNTGKLMKTQEKRTEKSPDLWGSVKFDPEYLRHMIESSSADLVEIKINGWKKVSKAGNSYLSLAVNTMDQQAKPVANDGKDPWDD